MTIKEMRALTGMSQAKFGEYLHISKRTIEDWESERRKSPQYVVELIEYKLKRERLIPEDT